MKPANTWWKWWSLSVPQSWRMLLKRCWMRWKSSHVRRWCIMCLSNTFAIFVGCIFSIFVYNSKCLGIYDLRLCFSNSVIKHDRALCGGKRCAGLQSVLRWNHVSVIAKLYIMSNFPVYHINIIHCLSDLLITLSGCMLFSNQYALILTLSLFLSTKKEKNCKHS